jgi:uncharacterized membrane protein
MMALSNFLFDLHYFAGCAWCYQGFWLYFARATATLFVLLAGVSLSLSHSRIRGRPGSFIAKKYLKRGLRIFSYGLLVTAATWLFLGRGFVVFGILHLIGLSIILSYPFLERKNLGLVSGIIIILLGFFVQNISTGFPWLVWAGLKPPGFFSVDYTPVLPWSGLVLTGIFLGKHLFPGGKGRFGQGFSSFFPIRILSKLGRNSLIIYLAHQPLFVGIIYLMA